MGTPSEQELAAGPAGPAGTPRQAPRSDEELRSTLLETLAGVVDPELGGNIVELGMVRDVAVAAGAARIELALTVASCPLRDQLRDDVERRAGALEGIDRVEIVLGAMAAEERAELMSKARRIAQSDAVATDIPEDARILAVVSGKGGVGKSSVTVNLAAALARVGATVGLLDADIWGFSVPRLLGIDSQLSVENKKMLPVERPVGEGLLKVVSMGFLSGEDEAIMWRGLILNRAVQHFLEDVAWGDLDYLLIDMPPGTGDVQMGLARMLPRTELLVVTTPALAAQKVAGRAADMARKGHLRIAGVIENMAGFTCEHGVTYELFGSGGGRRLADEIGAPLLGSIPLDPGVARGGDNGTPVALLSTHPLSSVFAELAHRVVSEAAPRVAMRGCTARIVAALKDSVTSAAV